MQGFVVPDGRVDPVLLAAIAHGSDAKRRPAQEQIERGALLQWADAGVSAMIEAPTGTGKSLAILAAALDWLAKAPEHTAVITTFTKQLQQQLAMTWPHSTQSCQGYWKPATWSRASPAGCPCARADCSPTS